jgi:predicted CXXCH cytochrome family protein
MRRLLLYICMIALVVTGLSGYAIGARPSHMDILANSEGCAACHAGRGIGGSGLLQGFAQELCFKCHGKHSRPGRTRAKTDMETVFNKVSAHPVFDTAKIHSVTEVLPESNARMPRHISCSDCHKVHISTSEDPSKGARGYSPGAIRKKGFGGPKGRTLREVTGEYELCYKCHADSENMPADSSNIAEQFDPGNPSYHPVEVSGRNNNVPSLVKGLSIATIISCAHCHGNNDLRGPQGPHGSDYAPLLNAQYRQDGGPEFYSSYELCYQCHDRKSILADDSFKRHKFHLVQVEASCGACHTAHGSLDNSHLIEFDKKSVFASNSASVPTYIPGAAGQPKCYLNCHGVEHDINKVGANPWIW